MNRYFPNDDPFVEERREMVHHQIRSRGITDQRVLAAMEKVPRHLFLPSELQHAAYRDYPLPIGEGQTISQPFIVAVMTQALALTGNEKILEIGTGVGYQTAILAELGKEVFTIERLPSLAELARVHLQKLGYDNVRTIIGDGTGGLLEHSPFDRIIATGSLPRIPHPLREQLSDGGILVLPIGSRREQELLRLRRVRTKFQQERLGGCRFVPLIGAFGWSA